ncbi:MAG: hypothetical protein WBA40_12545 [Roseiarcus sp.]
MKLAFIIALLLATSPVAAQSTTSNCLTLNSDVDEPENGTLRIMAIADHV